MKQYIAILCGEMFVKDEELIQDTICWLVELEPRTESCYCNVKGCDDYEPNNRFIDVIMQFPSGKVAEEAEQKIRDATATVEQANNFWPLLGGKNALADPPDGELPEIEVSTNAPPPPVPAPLQPPNSPPYQRTSSNTTIIVIGAIVGSCVLVTICLATAYFIYQRRCALALGSPALWSEQPLTRHGRDRREAAELKLQEQRKLSAAAAAAVARDRRGMPPARRGGGGGGAGGGARRAGDRRGGSIPESSRRSIDSQRHGSMGASHAASMRSSRASAVRPSEISRTSAMI